MSVVKAVGAGMVWNSTATMIGKALIFVNVFLILTFLSVYEYGFFELIMSVISTVGIFMLPGLVNTIVADMAVERGRKNLAGMKEIFHQYFSLNIVLAVIAWSILFFASHPVAKWAGNPYVSQFLVIASFQFLLTPFRQMAQLLATTTLRFFDQSFYGVFEEAVKCVLLLVLVVWLKLGLHGLLYATVFSQLAVVVGFIPRSLSAYRYFSSAKIETGHHFWNVTRRHRKWSIGSSYIGTLSQNARVWIIKLMLGTEAVGLFAFAYGILSQVVSLMPLTSILAPIIPRYLEKREQFVRILRAAIKFQVVLSVAFIICMLATTHLFVTAFFPKYLAAVPIIYILALSLFSNSIVSLFIPVFAAFKEQRSLLFSNTLKFALCLVFLPSSIYLFGLYGTGVELVLTTGFNSLERYFRLKRLVPEFTMPLRDVFAPDPYEKEAIGTIWGTVRSRAPRVWPLTRIL